MPERAVVYALMTDYEGAYAVYTTLEAAIEKAQEDRFGADYIEKWYLNEADPDSKEVVWSCRD